MLAENGTADNCTYHKQVLLEFKFYFIVLCGTALSLISVLENSVLFYLFVSRPKLRHSNVYLAMLAAMDVSIAICYITIMTVGVLYDWIPSLLLFNLWHAYLQPMFTLSHSVMAASSFLIMAATFERYLITTQQTKHFQWMRSNRTIIGGSAILLGVLIRGTIFWEVVVEPQENCTRFAAMKPILSPLAENVIYKTVWTFWFRNFSTVFVPFITLAYCNTVIVMTLRQSGSPQRTNVAARNGSLRKSVGHYLRSTVSVFRRSRKAFQGKGTVRSATRMLILVVCTYLMANALNVFITAWEFIDRNDLIFNHEEFYSISTDVVSLSTVLTGVVRLPIYVSCNDAIHVEFRHLFGCGRSTSERGAAGRPPMERFNSTVSYSAVTAGVAITTGDVTPTTPDDASQSHVYANPAVHNRLNKQLTTNNNEDAAARAAARNSRGGRLWRQTSVLAPMAVAEEDQGADDEPPPYTPLVTDHNSR